MSSVGLGIKGLNQVNDAEDEEGHSTTDSD